MSMTEFSRLHVLACGGQLLRHLPALGKGRTLSHQLFFMSQLCD
jgi:hypothetical protein